jgi:hypothetical protein
MDEPPAVLAGTPLAEPPRATWTLGDIAKALAFPAFLFFASLLVVVTGGGDTSEEDYTEGELIVLLGFGVVFELFMLFMVWWFTVRKYRLSWGELGVRRPQRGGFWLGGGLLLGGLAITFSYSLLLQIAGAEVESDLPEGIYDNAGPIVILVLTAVILAPVVEELFFRGFIFGGFRKAWGTVAAAVGSGLIFGLMHLGNPGTLYIVPPIAAIGALFAWGYIYSGSLLPSMIAHLLFNALSVGGQALSS